MLSRLLRLSALTALTLVMGVAACDRPSNITDVNSSTYNPQFSTGAATAAAKGQANGLAKKQLQLATVNATPGTYYAKERINPSGGTISLAGGALVLTVPKGAVGPQTWFRVTLTITDHAVVTAYASSSWDDNAPLNDVGAAGFKKPLTLSISKFGATPSDPQSRLVIGEIINGGFVASPTAEQGDFLSAPVWHFSEYGILE
jgi:hypothetical protein